MRISTSLAAGVIAALSALAVSAGSEAKTVAIGVIDVTDYGRIDPSAPDYVQPGAATGTAQLQFGQPSGPGNPTELSNPGWDPYGASDTSHLWWNVEGGAVTLNLTSDTLSIVWGSPNDDDPSSSNIVSFYSGVNGGGTLIGSVLAYDLYANFAGINNTTDPGYLVSFATPSDFGSVVFTTGPSDFEFAVVPEPSTWAMMLLGFAGLGFAGYSRNKKPRLAVAIA